MTGFRTSPGGLRESSDSGDSGGPKWELTGVLAGAVSTLVFTWVHQLTISDIWYMALPMVVAGSMAGAVIAWTYRGLATHPTVGGWVAFNGWVVALLGAMGLSSAIVYEPTTTMAAVMAASGPVDDLIVRALPLTGCFVAAATFLTGRVFAGTWRLRMRILVTVLVVTVVLGLNLSVLGLVDFAGASIGPLMAFFGLTGLLALVYTAVFVGLRRDLRPPRRPT